jgi:hypothetical protein
MTETVVVLGVLKKLMEIVETKKALKKVGMAIAELLIDFTAIAFSIVVSLVIPSILPNIAELAAEIVYVAVGGAASLVTLTVADLKKKVLRWGEK